MSPKHLLACTLALGLVLTPLFAVGKVASQDPPQASAQAGAKQEKATHRSDHGQDDAQRIFEQNCSRCHATPDGFSPRISGTVVRHMRLRASLSAHDEELLLRFLNP